MLRQTFLNTLLTGFAQAISMLVIIALAGTLEAEQFGTLNVQLSTAALLSIICTLQFERVYVRIKHRALAHYVGFHVRCLVLVFAVLCCLSLPLKTGPSSVVLAAAIALSQISLYAAARQGQFQRIWLMKLLQAASLLILSFANYIAGRDDFYWLAFFGSYLCAGLVVFDKKTLAELKRFTLKNDVRRFKFSFSIAAKALGSLLTGSFTREFPVLLCGAMGQQEAAGALGLVTRTVGAPIGLLARSASAVMAGYVATNRLNKDAMRKLLLVPAIGAFYILAVVALAGYVPALSKYDQFAGFMLALAPFFLIRAYVGLLGSALVFYRLQDADLKFNIAAALAAALSGLLAYSGNLDLSSVLWLISIVSTVFGVALVYMLAKNLAKV